MVEPLTLDEDGNDIAGYASKNKWIWYWMWYSIILYSFKLVYHKWGWFASRKPAGWRWILTNQIGSLPPERASCSIPSHLTPATISNLGSFISISPIMGKYNTYYAKPTLTKLTNKWPTPCSCISNKSILLFRSLKLPLLHIHPSKVQENSCDNKRIREDPLTKFLRIVMFISTTINLKKSHWKVKGAKNKATRKILAMYWISN